MVKSDLYYPGEQMASSVYFSGWPYKLVASPFLWFTLLRCEKMNMSSLSLFKKNGLQ